LNSILDNTRDDEEAFADVIAFVVGGFHTTGNFLSWLFYYLVIRSQSYDV
jgi:cytochrome P450